MQEKVEGKERKAGKIAVVVLVVGLTLYRFLVLGINT